MIPLKKHKIQLSIIYLNLILFSCITQFEPDVPYDDTQVLVVEGQITDETGPFRVKLTYSFEVNNMQLYGQPASDAEVFIHDDSGNLFSLYYISNGWYVTEDSLLSGVPGRTYTLDITMADGTKYESSPVLMQTIPDIDSVYFEEVQKVRFEDGEAIEESWLNIYVDSEDQAKQTHYWKWDFVETWQISLLTDSIPVGLYFPAFYTNVELAPHVEKNCWVNVPSTSILIATTSGNSNDKINKFLLTSIPSKSHRLHIKYSMLVKQTALSPEFYNYWKRLKESNEETGGIYEKIPEQIFGNIDCCSGDNSALGYFYASSVKTKRIFIKPHKQPLETKSAYAECLYALHDPRVLMYFYGVATASASNPGIVGTEIWTYNKYCSDCLHYGHSSSVKPDFWED